ncbi:MAG: 2-nitropropane dioxygenase, partial [Psychromonas sp.]|nr:2-nitropropane dioxygenase [Psychromonas sp.]
LFRSLVFRRDFATVWQDTENFFRERDPRQIERAQIDPHYKLALVFRWYLGLSSRWSNIGESGREMDYQIWAGPSLGAFNSWVKGSYLEKYSQRKAVDVALHLLKGAAYLQRITQLKLQGVSLQSNLSSYRPE